MIGGQAKPQYIRGETGTVHELNDDYVVVLLDRVVGKFTSRHLRRAPEIGALYAIGEWLNLAQAFTAVRDGRAGRSGRDVCVREPWPADL